MARCCASRSPRNSSRASIRWRSASQHGDLLDRRAHGAQSVADRRPSVVLAGHSRKVAREFSRRNVCSWTPSGRSGVPLNRSATPSTWMHRAFIFIMSRCRISQQRRAEQAGPGKRSTTHPVAAEHGWGEYRTPPAFQDAVMATYSFNNRALLRVHETIKDSLDPNGILAAGRSGIWPKHLGGTRMRPRNPEGTAWSRCRARDRVAQQPRERRQGTRRVPVLVRLVSWPGQPLPGHHGASGEIRWEGAGVLDDRTDLTPAAFVFSFGAGRRSCRSSVRPR